jgi:hypothetical protein
VHAYLRDPVRTPFDRHRRRPGLADATFYHTQVGQSTATTEAACD